MQVAQVLNDAGLHEMARQMLTKSSIPFTNLTVRPMQSSQTTSKTYLPLLSPQKKTELNNSQFSSLQNHFKALQSYSVPLFFYITVNGIAHLLYEVNCIYYLHSVESWNGSNVISRVFLTGKLAGWKIFEETSLLVMVSDTYEICIVEMAPELKITRKQLQIMGSELTAIEPAEFYIHQKQNTLNNNYPLDKVSVQFVGIDRVLYKLDGIYFKRTLQEILSIIVLKGPQAAAITKNAILVLNFQTNTHSQLLSTPQGIDIIACAASLNKMYYYIILNNQSIHLYKLGEAQFKYSQQLQSNNTQIEIIDDDNFIIKVGDEIIQFKSA